MPKPRSHFTIELVEDEEPDIIELVAMPPCTFASMDIPDDAQVRFLRRIEGAPAPRDASSGMTIVLADARACITIAPPAERSLSTLAVAIVAVDSLEAFEPEFVSSSFDVVLPIVVAPDAELEPALTAALRAFTSFATASIVSLSVNEASRFFLGAGWLAIGRGEALDITSATQRALREALESGGHRSGHLFYHLEVDGGALMEDLCLATKVLAGIGGESYLAVSSSPDLRKRATVLLSSRPIRYRAAS